LAKIAENCDHNIDPWSNVSDVSGISTLDGDRILISDPAIAELSIPADAKLAFTVVKGSEDCGVARVDGMSDVIPRITGEMQGCQMVYFQTINSNLGKFWRALDGKCC
jgi:hypothetical protein